MWTKVKRLVNIIYTLNLHKSFYYSYATFGLSTAFKLPILIGKNVKIRGWGQVKFDCKPESGMISIGYRMLSDYENQNEHLVFSNQGLVLFCGPVNIRPGVKIVVYENGLLVFGGNNNLGRKTTVICKSQINFGKGARCSWDCDISDNEEYRIIEQKIEVKSNSTFIVIGDNVFIGNHCSICKGIQIANGCVISAYSKVSSSFFEENLLIMGNPAKAVSHNKTMSNIWDGKEQEYAKILNEE